MMMRNGKCFFLSVSLPFLSTSLWCFVRRNTCWLRDKRFVDGDRKEILWDHSEWLTEWPDNDSREIGWTLKSFRFRSQSFWFLNQVHFWLQDGDESAAVSQILFGSLACVPWMPWFPRKNRIQRKFHHRICCRRKTKVHRRVLWTSYSPSLGHDSQAIS